MRLRTFLLGVLVAVLCASFSMPLMAQDAGSARGNLGGLVYDTSNSLVPGAKVTITGPIGTLAQNTTEQGSFLFSTLIPGYYKVRVEKSGFKVSELANIEVLVNRTSSVQVTLEAGTVSQTVEVSADAQTVDSSSASINSDLADTLYEKIPVQRNVASLFYLAPGVASGMGTGNANPSISGASGLENLYVADGVTVNDPAFGGLGVWSRVYGSLGSGINLSFVKEVQVKTAGFEPQYGHSSGGVVQIVTKSGGTATHGVLGGYANTTNMQTAYANADDPQFHEVNLIGRHLEDSRYEGDFELGGYVPLASLKNHLFYFGTFNPTWLYSHFAPAAGSGLFSIYNGNTELNTRSWDYAGKVTFKINDKHTIESSVFGDPNTNPSASWFTLNSNNTSANSTRNYGTRNWVVRYDGALSSDWLVDGAFTWSWNHFTETPSQDIFQIVDVTQSQLGVGGAFNAQGIGLFEPYDAQSKGFNLDTSKGYSFAGKHTFSVGYTFSRPVYNDIVDRSGGRFDIPTTNATGGTYLTPGQQAVIPAGSTTNGTFQLTAAPASAGCTLCPNMDVDGIETPVYLLQTRGTFSSGVTHSTGLYNAAYANDSWAIGTHVTLNLGLRWEQQRVNGNVAGANFGNMWEPRVSFIVDPKGDRKSKLYASFGRYAYVLPLDIALRSLSSEADYENADFAPAADASGNVILNSLGTVTPVLDAAHLLNNATGGIGGNVSVSAQSAGEPFAPGTRMEYNDEYVVGGEHEFRGGIVASARYIDRRMRRVIEDFSGISLEGGLAGLPQTYVIGNPSATTDAVVNPNEIAFSLNTPFNPTNFVASNPTVAGCFDANGNAGPNVLNAVNTFGQVVGSACFPSVNLNPWTTAGGTVISDGTGKCSATNACFGGEVGADGKVDGFNNPTRIYQAVELEVNKSFSHNWLLLANWRIARLQGNYEGAFRNDNGQADPGISSLFDFTPGLLGLLGAQQSTGILNSDRKHIINVNTTYVLPGSFLRGFVFGGGITIQSGVPLTTLAAQEYYQNPGEVPLFGRGDLGRAPVTGVINAHLEYPWRLSDRFTLKFGMDLFNIANTKRETLINEDVDLGFGIPNADFKKPVAQDFVAPFQARAIVRLEF